MSKYDTPKGMKTYVVVWRMDEDEFFWTLHDIEEDWDPSIMTNNKWVSMSFDVEYPDQPNPFHNENTPSYELLGVFSGTDLSFF